MNILRQFFKPTKLEQLAKIYKKFEPLIAKNELDKAQTLLNNHPALISYINLDIRGWGEYYLHDVEYKTYENRAHGQTITQYIENSLYTKKKSLGELEGVDTLDRLDKLDPETIQKLSKNKERVSVFQSATTPEAIHFLMRVGCQAENTDNQGVNGLRYFLLNKRWDMAEAICEATPCAVFPLVESLSKKSIFETIFFHYIWNTNILDGYEESQLLKLLNITLTKGLDVNAPLSEGLTPLSHGASLGREYEKLIDFLLDNGALPHADSLSISPHYQTSEEAHQQSVAPQHYTVSPAFRTPMCRAFLTNNEFLAEKIIARYHSPKDMVEYEREILYPNPWEREPQDVFIAKLHLLREKYTLQNSIQVKSDNLSTPHKARTIKI